MILSLYPKLKLRSRESLLQAQLMVGHPGVSTYQMVLMLQQSLYIPHGAQLDRNQIRINLDVSRAKKDFSIHQREVIVKNAQSLHILTVKPVKYLTKLYLKMGHSICTTLLIQIRYAQKAPTSAMEKSLVQLKTKP
jgi:hypothetical protein